MCQGPSGFAITTSDPHIGPMAKRSVVRKRWLVSMIRGAKNQTLGYVVAPDEKEAIEMAILEHRISDPERQRRLSRARTTSRATRLS
jgi:hypothetical protein